MTEHFSSPRNAVLFGDCINILSGFAPSTVDFVLTDPPYIVGYQSRDGKRVHNDDNAAWLQPSFAQIYRVLRPGSYSVSFYGWNRLIASSPHGPQPVFASSATSYSASNMPRAASFCVIRTNALTFWPRATYRRPPRQSRMSSTGGVVLDPFCGSGSTLVAAQKLDRAYVGIEIDPIHHKTAHDRLAKFSNEFTQQPLFRSASSQR